MIVSPSTCGTLHFRSELSPVNRARASGGWWVRGVIAQQVRPSGLLGPSHPLKLLRKIIRNRLLGLFHVWLLRPSHYKTHSRYHRQLPAQVNTIKSAMSIKSCYQSSKCFGSWSREPDTFTLINKKKSG